MTAGLRDTVLFVNEMDSKDPLGLLVHINILIL